jgi:DNA polymerase (family 10)
MKRRKQYYEHHYSSWIKNVSKKSNMSRNSNQINLFIMCEVDILANGELALPPEAFDYVDAVIVSVHSSFATDKRHMTERVLGALTAHPKVRIFGHPTGRLLGKREGYELEWDAVFSACKEYGIALEINAYPMRLDLPDSVIPDAIGAGVAMCINTDSHAVDQMDLMRYGVSVARRGWAQSRDIINAMDYNGFTSWLKKEV